MDLRRYPERIRRASGPGGGPARVGEPYRADV